MLDNCMTMYEHGFRYGYKARPICTLCHKSKAYLNGYASGTALRMRERVKAMTA